MLVLTRKIGEKLIIADDIVIQVLSVSGDQVKLGIQAPASISVHRNEVYEAIATGAANAADGKATNRPPFSRRPKPALVKKNDASE